MLFFLIDVLCAGGGRSPFLLSFAMRLIVWRDCPTQSWWKRVAAPPGWGAVEGPASGMVISFELPSSLELGMFKER